MLGAGNSNDEGNDKFFLCQDNKKLSFDWLMEQFLNSKCPFLKRKPRLSYLTVAACLKFYSYIGFANGGRNTAEATFEVNLQDIFTILAGKPGTETWEDGSVGTFLVQKVELIYPTFARLQS